MRTTLVLDDRLFRAAKQRAADLGTSLSDVVNQALRDALSQRPAPRRKLKLITYGRGENKVHHEPADFAAALESEDMAALGR